jgi:IclR family acetate operon transcriptional repressor
LKKRTPKTITSVPRLVAELERVRDLGHSVDDEENSLGARCVGAPIFDSTGVVVAALGASGTLTQTDDANLARIVESLKDAARKISRQLLKSGAPGI